MTTLRTRMMEDMQVRNLSRHTQDAYLLQVSQFVRHFAKSPALLGPEDIRAYQVYLTNEKKLAPRSVHVTVAALRFFLPHHARPRLGFRSGHSMPKGAKDTGRHSQPRGGAALSRLYREPQTPSDSDDMLCRRPAYFRGHSAEARGYRSPAHGAARRAGQGTERPLRHAVGQVAGGADELLARRATHGGMAISRRSCWRTDIDKRRGCHLP
jgi:hypothetical protein